MIGRNQNKAPWRSLAELDGPPQYGFQKALSYFQINFWLTGTDLMRIAFAKATAYFTLQVFQDGMKGYKSISPSRTMRQLLIHPSYRGLYDYSLVKNNPVDLLGLASFASEVRRRGRVSKYMHTEAYYAQCRLAVFCEKGEDRLTWAREYFQTRAYKPEDAEKMVGWNGKLKDPGFRRKAAYLAAARLVLPRLLEFNENSIATASDEAPTPLAFEYFCRHIIAIADALDCGGSADLRRWTGLEPLMPEVPPMPVELSTKLSKASHGPAEETAIGKRGKQNP